MFFQAVDFTSVLLRRLDSEEVVYILLSELDVPRPVEYRNSKFVGIVNHAMLRETADFGIVTFFGMSLDECSVSGIFDSVDPVAFLNRDFLAINNVIDLGVETRCFCYKLKAEKVVTTIDGIFDRDSLCEVVENRFGNDSRIVVDIKPSCRSNTTHQLTALDFRAAVNGNLDIVVDILLNDFRDSVLFKLKARSILPLLTDSIVAFKVIITETHHNTIGVELHDFEGRAVSHKMDCKLQESELPSDAHRPSHEGVKQVVVLREHRTVGRVCNELQCVSGCLIAGLLRPHTSFEHIGIILRIRNVSAAISIQCHKVRIVAADITVSQMSAVLRFLPITRDSTVNPAVGDCHLTIPDFEVEFTLEHLFIGKRVVVDTVEEAEYIFGNVFSEQIVRVDILTLVIMLLRNGIKISSGQFCICHIQRPIIGNTLDSAKHELVFDIVLSQVVELFGSINIVLTVEDSLFKLLLCERTVDVEVNLRLSNIHSEMSFNRF